MEAGDTGGPTRLAALLHRLPRLRHLRVGAPSRAALLDVLRRYAEGSPGPAVLCASFLWLRERGAEGGWELTATLDKVKGVASCRAGGMGVSA